MDQVKHLIPVYGMMRADRICGILNCLFHQLHLLDTVAYQLQLDVQGIFHKMIVRVINGHFPDIIQGETQIFQKQDLGKSCKILICIKTCAGFCYIGGFEDILFVIIADSAERYMCHPCKFSGRVVAVFFHGKTFFKKNSLACKCE